MQRVTRRSFHYTTPHLGPSRTHSALVRLAYSGRGMAGLVVRAVGVLGAVIVIVMLVSSQPVRSSAMSGNTDIAQIKAGADDGRQEFPEHAPRGLLPVLGIAMVLAGVVIIVASRR
jgi:hypothetical protein